MVHASQPARIKTRIFLSYSRKDAPFAIWLRQQLEAHDIEVFRDVDDTLPGEQWWARLVDLIAKADMVVFALSPHSAASKVCVDEVAKALTLNKRIVPALIADVDWQAVPEGLAKVHSVIFTNEAERDARVAQLVTALGTDIVWVREHTRLGEISGRWAAGRPSDLLLRGRELEAAETWLTRQPPTATPPTNMHLAFIKASRDAARRRQRWTAGLSATAAVVAIGLGIFAEVNRRDAVAQKQEVEVQRGQVVVQRDLAQSNEKKATAERDRALRNQSALLANQSKIRLGEGDSNSAIELALSALPGRNAGGENRPYAPEAEASLFAATFSNRELAVLSGGDGPIRSYDIAPDASRIATTDGADARLWSGQTGALLAALPVPAGLTLSLISLSPDGSHVVAGASDGSIVIWDIATGKVTATLKAGDGVLWKIVLSSDGQRHAAVFEDRTITLWRASGGDTPIATMQIPQHYLDVRFIPQSYRFLTISGPQITLWNAETGQKVAILAEFPLVEPKTEAEQIHLLAQAEICPTGGQVIVKTHPNKADVRDTGSQLQSFAAADGKSTGQWLSAKGQSAYGLTCSPDGTQIAITKQSYSGGRAHSVVQLLDSTTMAEQKEFATSGDRVIGRNVGVPYYFPDGKHLLTIDWQNVGYVWNVSTGHAEGESMRHPLDVSAVALSSESKTVVTATKDGTLYFWDAASGRLNSRLKGHVGAPDHVQPQPGFDRLVSASTEDGTIRIWDTGGQGTSNSATSYMPIANGSLSSLAFSPDGQTYVGLFTSKTAATIQSIDSKTLTVGQSEWLPAGFRYQSGYSILSHDGRFIIGNDARSEYFVIDRTDPSKSPVPIPAKGLFSKPPQFDAVKDRIVTVANNKRFAILNSVTAKEEVVFDCALCEPSNAIGNSFVFRPDGKQIAIQIMQAGRWISVFYDVSSGVEVGRIAAYGSVRYFPDSSRFLFNGNSYLQVYDATTFRPGVTIREAAFFNEPALSTDGRKIIAIFNNGSTVKVWDAQSGAELAGFTHRTPVQRVLMTPDQSRIITWSQGYINYWRYFPNTAAMIEHARAALPRCLSPQQRKQVLLEPTPPAWCITGLGHEDDPEPAHWTPKWPYQNAAWRQWLIAKRIGKEQPLPIAAQ